IVHAQDSLRLVNLYNSTEGPNWINSTNWLSDLPISEWHGITFQDSSVNAIELPRNNLSGQLSEDIGELTNLEILNLSDNNLSGDLPVSFKNSVELKSIDLSHNQFSGSPVKIFIKMGNLVSLDLSYNNFNGRIPKDLGKLGKLKILNLSNNNFQNTIPIEIFRLQELIELNLQMNSLTGSIPRQIGNCTNLQILDLSRNKLTGKIPKELGKLQYLTHRLALDHNNLSGLIPKELSLLSNLQHIWLNNNQFSGILPFEIGKMKSLRSLFIYQNNFVGPIPLTVGNLRELEIFYSQNNSFGGKVPQELWFLPKLKMLRLENNQLSGTIPGDLRILKSIQSIDLSNNRFDSISDSIALPTSLLSFNITDNNLFCINERGETDSLSFVLHAEVASKVKGLEQQNCIDNSWSSFSIGTDNIDFEYVKTDTTAERQFWITTNNSRTNILLFHHFDNNFYLSDSLLKIDQDDTIFVSLSYSPIDVDTHYDVLIIEDIINNNSKFISVIGEGVESLIPERDTSIPWKFKLHPISIEAESDTINIQYDVPEESNINITIFNLGGRPIKTIMDGIIEVGFHTFKWDGSDDSGNSVERGEYLCVMQAGMFIQIKQILLLY
ncbi:MAG: FlgD immunoglobulin-like domain containing protein, partial [Candidatus Neomarinimicrobiota bacterium]